MKNESITDYLQSNNSLLAILETRPQADVLTLYYEARVAAVWEGKLYPYRDWFSVDLLLATGWRWVLELPQRGAGGWEK